MSFFGFDSTLPRGRGHPARAPGFGETPDHFAALSNAAGEDDGIDFEDTYDGLGDALDEKDDVFNDETFGGAEEAAPVGRDFDFHGATARVANVIEEEHEVYSRLASKKKPQAEPVVVEETPRLPALEPDMSLWASSVPASIPRHQEAQAAYSQPAMPGARKVLSLEEVEAQILAASQKPASRPQPMLQPENISGQFPTQQLQHIALENPPPSGVSLQLQGSQDLHQFPQQQLPPHLQQMLQRNESLQNVSNIPNIQHAFQEPSARAVPQLPSQPAMAREQPAPSQGRNQYGMTTHLPAHQLQNMSETERVRYLEEESKRLKRNHKIAQLARYNGLMTPSDKNFITRIQLQQLVSINNAEDNPNEDFYYIVHSAIRARANPQQPLNQFAQTYLFRQGNRSGSRRQENHLQRMEQQVARAVAAAKARPKASQLVLEGSLGKISFSNVKTPRPMLNIKKSDGPGGDHVRKAQTLPRSSADRKFLLRVVENVYDALLELEIHERDRAKLSIIQPGQAAQPSHLEWGAKRDRLADKLWKEMKVMEPIDSTSNFTHPFIAILSYSKMKRAIPRIFRHLDPEQRLTVLTMVVVHLHILDVVKHGVYMPDETQLPSAFREEIEMFSSCVLPPLLAYVYEAPLSMVVGLLGILLERVDVRAVSRTKIGLAFLTTFSSRAELVKQSGQASDAELQDWEQMYNRLFDSLQGHWMECFPPSGKFVDDVYVWQFLASMAVGANMHQQQALVGAVKDRVMENVMASKTLPPELGAQKSANVNLFMRAMGLDVELLG